MSAPQVVTASILVGLLALAATPLQSCRSNKSASTSWSDASITTSVKSKLIGSGETKARNIDVNTEEGTVYLMGRVDTHAEKAEAERIARTVEGVRQVVNHLQVGDAK